MRNLKRALSLALSSVMLMGMMVVGTSASYVDVASEHNTEAIEVLQAVGIMTGDEKGNFNPDANVTRNEMAVIMCNLMDYVVSSYKGTAPFTDVPDWAADYVAACYTNGIVAGMSATQYGGDNSVTTGQAALMLMKALGYFQYQGDFGDDWLVETTKLGTQNGIFDGVDNGAIEALTRNQVAQMILNTLEADAVAPNGNSGVTIVDGNLVAGRATYSPRTGSGKKFTKIGDTNVIQLGEELYDGDLEKFTKKEDSFGRSATQWKYKGSEVGTYGDAADQVLVVNDIYTNDKNKSKSLLDVLQDLADNDDLTYPNDLENKAEFWLNGDEKSAADLKAEATYGTTYELFMVENEPDEIERVVAYNYVLDQITDVDDDVSSSDSKKGVSAYVNFDNSGDDIKNTDIPGFNPDTYVEDAYVALVVNDDGDIIDSFIPETVEGSISTRKNAESVVVDGQRYYAAGTIDTAGDFTAVDKVSTSSDDSYRLYLDKDNRILAIEGIEASSDLSDVYYVDVVWNETNTVAGADVTSYYAQLVSLDDGTKAEYKLETKDHELGTGKNDLSASKYDFDALSGSLVTISDKKTGDSKANNDKWNLKTWSDKDWDVYTSTGKFTPDLSKSATRLSNVPGISSKRLNSSTVYLFLEDTRNDLDVSRYVGGVSYKSEVNSAIVITEDGSSVASYVLFCVNDADQKTEFSEDVIFVKSESSERGDGYRDQDVYLPDGSKETWQIDGGEYGSDGLKTPAFYTYGTNDDGYYELDEAEAMTVTGNLDWQDDKDEGVLAGVIFDDKNDLYDNLLTVTLGKYEVQDIDVSDAKFTDVRSKDDRDEDDQYSSALGSLDAVRRNLDNGRIEEATLYMNVSKDGAVCIFLTSATAGE